MKTLVFKSYLNTYLRKKLTWPQRCENVENVLSLFFVVVEQDVEGDRNEGFYKAGDVLVRQLLVVYQKTKQRLLYFIL